MVQREGYGQDWSHWDAFINHKWPRPDKVKYKNWCPFLSPKGTWMAFCNESYTDICIINLETKEIVVKDFYSHNRFEKNDDGTYKRNEKGYYVNAADHFYDGFHTNVATYVPHFTYSHFEYESSGGQKQWIASYVEDHDFLDNFDPQNPDKLFEIKKDLYTYYEDRLILSSLPLAFNQYTFWAADDEFYCDVLDLSEIDQGVLKRYDLPSFIIPRSAEHVRNFVKCSYLGDLTNTPEKVDAVTNISIMEETKCHRFYPESKRGPSSLSNAHELKGAPYSLNSRLPWEQSKDRQAEVKLKYEIEAEAERIYNTWSDQPEFVPWFRGGNSSKQDEARSLARANLTTEKGN